MAARRRWDTHRSQSATGNSFPRSGARAGDECTLSWIDHDDADQAR